MRDCTEDRTMMNIKNNEAGTSLVMEEWRKYELEILSDYSTTRIWLCLRMY